LFFGGLVLSFHAHLIFTSHYHCCPLNNMLVILLMILFLVVMIILLLEIPHRCHPLDGLMVIFFLIKIPHRCHPLDGLMVIFFLIIMFVSFITSSLYIVMGSLTSLYFSWSSGGFVPNCHIHLVVVSHHHHSCFDSLLMILFVIIMFILLLKVPCHRYFLIIF